MSDLIVLVSFALFGNYNIIGRLADAKTARGLITFLFALGTIGTALIITISVFTSNCLPNESKERFYRAKEILTILIGILGTIVGFYFGAPIDSKSVSKLNLSAPVISPEIAVAGQPFTLISRVKGGSPPYVYSLKVTTGDDKLEENLSGHIQDGLLVAPLTLADGAHTIRLSLVDANNGSFVLSRKLIVGNRQ